MLAAYPVHRKHLSEILMLVMGLILATVIRASDLSEQAVNSVHGEVVLPVTQDNLNTLAVSVNQMSGAAEGEFSLVASERTQLQTDYTLNQQDKSVVAWLEKTINPVYQWISQLRSLSVEQRKHNPMLINSRAKVEQFSAGMNKAISAAMRRYDGVVLSVKRLTEEESIYRIKLLRRSGELHALDYNEELDQFISGDDGRWYANSAD
jgi:hypothetical protein